MATSRTSTSVWKNRRAQVIAMARAEGLTNCPLCGRWLAWGTHGRPDSPEVDHIEPFHVTREIAPEVDKLRVVCRACNGTKDSGGAKAVREHGPQDVRVSQPW